MKLYEHTHASGSVDYSDRDLVASGYWKADAEVTVREVDNRCGYDVHAGWGPMRCGNENPCPDHQAKCWCGARATGGCSDAGGQFVCGTPVCDEHHYCARHK